MRRRLALVAILASLSLNAKLHAAEVTVRLPDATLQSLVTFVCAHSWVVHHWAPTFSCQEPDIPTVLEELARGMGAEVEIHVD